MRRRRRQPPDAPPELLCRFVPQEWPGALSVPDAFSKWMGARFGWWLDHPDDPLPEGAEEEARRRIWGARP